MNHPIDPRQSSLLKRQNKQTNKQTRNEAQWALGFASLCLLQLPPASSGYSSHGLPSSTPYAHLSSTSLVPQLFCLFSANLCHIMKLTFPKPTSMHVHVKTTHTHKHRGGEGWREGKRGGSKERKKRGRKGEGRRGGREEEKERDALISGKE